MTEKAKAQELREKFGDKASDVVDEIMKIERLFTNNRTCKFEGYGYTSSIEFWQAVKAELMIK